MTKKETAPSEDLEPPTFYVGRDSHGRWIAQDADHLRGGLFISRAAAMKFAMDETGHRPDAIVPLTQIIELDFGARALRQVAIQQPMPRAA